MATGKQERKKIMFNTIMLNALKDITLHAYEEDTPREDIEADFDRMKEIACAAILKVEELG